MEKARLIINTAASHQGVIKCFSYTNGGTFIVSIFLNVSAVWVISCVYFAINEPPHNTSPLVQNICIDPD